MADTLLLKPPPRTAACSSAPWRHTHRHPSPPTSPECCSIAPLPRPAHTPPALPSLAESLGRSRQEARLLCCPATATTSRGWQKSGLMAGGARRVCGRLLASALLIAALFQHQAAATTTTLLEGSFEPGDSPESQGKVVAVVGRHSHGTMPTHAHTAGGGGPHARNGKRPLTTPTAPGVRSHRVLFLHQDSVRCRGYRQPASDGRLGLPRGRTKRRQRRVHPDQHILIRTVARNVHGASRCSAVRPRAYIRVGGQQQRGRSLPPPVAQQAEGSGGRAGEATPMPCFPRYPSDTSSRPA